MPSLSYCPSIPGQTGALYNAIGWFNFASLPTTVTTPFVTTLANGIKGGGQIQARFTLTQVGSGSTTFQALVPPTWSGAAFGNTAYLGLTTKVCLSDRVNQPPNFGQIVVDNLVITNKYGEPITDYDFYFTDSETPQVGGNQQFITNGTPWDIFYTLPNTGQGYCTLTGVGTTTVTTSGTGNVPILRTKNPTSITQTVTGGGAMTFGVSLTIAEIIKVVNGGRINDADQFKLDIVGVNSGTTITVGQNTGVQQQGLQIVSGLPGFFTFNEIMAAGSVSTLGLYNPTVQLSNATAGGTTLPNTLTLGSGVTLNNGDYAVMTITNTPADTQVSLNKTVDKTYSDVGETLNYTIVVQNSSPYDVRNIKVTDTVPSNTTFVTGSLTLDGNQVSGTPDPPTGVTVGTLPSGGVSTITFSVIVPNTVPSPNAAINSATTVFSPTINIGVVNSQTVVTTINTAQLASSKVVNKAFANVGDILTYTIVISNSGNVTANNVIFIDTIPNDTTLVSNSFKQDNTNISGSPNPPGVTLPNGIGGGKTSTVTFQVKINTIPNPNPIPNSATGEYTYTVDPSIPNASNGSVNTNTVITQVNNANLGNIQKSVDKQFATCGDVVTYTINIPNNGNVTAFNVIIKDTIPNGLSFIANSVAVNGTTISGANPLIGINVGTIVAGGMATVTFQGQIIC